MEQKQKTFVTATADFVFYKEHILNYSAQVHTCRNFNLRNRFLSVCQAKIKTGHRQKREQRPRFN